MSVCIFSVQLLSTKYKRTERRESNCNCVVVVGFSYCCCCSCVGGWGLFLFVCFLLAFCLFVSLCFFVLLSLKLVLIPEGRILRCHKLLYLGLTRLTTINNSRFRLFFNFIFYFIFIYIKYLLFVRLSL